MRASLFSAAVAAALAFTAWNPAEAKAQVFVYPSYYGGSYVNPIGYSAFSYPRYGYNYGLGYPGYSTYSYGWSNPYSTWAWSGYRAAPFYGSYYGGYRSGFGLGGYRGFRRW